MRFWYALRVRTNHEQAIQASPYAAGVEFFHPTYPEEARKGNSRVTVQRPLFPGYLFARFDPLESAAVRSISGVYDIVSIGETPAAIPDGEIESVRTLLASDRAVSPAPFLAPKQGDVVEVRFGPLAGARGVVIGAKNKSHSIFVVSVELLSRSIKAMLPTEHLRKAAA